MNQNIAQTLPEIAGEYPDRTGLVCKKAAGYESWTFKQINDTTDWYAHELTKIGVQRGDRVILMVKPSIDFISLTFALFKIGAVIILIDPGMGYRNLLRSIGQVKPTVFIGIPKASLFRILFPKPFRTVRISVCIGNSFGLLGTSLRADMAPGSKVYGHMPFPVAEMTAADPAAILFTTGSTGPPKGVRYEHSIFQAQLRLIKEYYKITPHDIDQPAFPLFALFSTALGACVVIPDMNPAQPARVEPDKFIQTIQDHQVTYSFGSPAIWNRVSNYCISNKITLPSVKKILMAGAPVPGELIKRTLSILPPDAEIHTPYGATESLPTSSITGTEILAETWEETRQGKGVCVGKSLPGISVRIIEITDEPIAEWQETVTLPIDQIGEIVVKGPVVTSAYDHNDQENMLAKIEDGKEIWHRMGDVGFMDEEGRLWFCGRKDHRVTMGENTLYTICCEALFNDHPAVFRSALVGIGAKKNQIPVLIVELHEKNINKKTLLAELEKIGKEHRLTMPINHFLVHAGFPVDIRHNAKIFREKLALWATEQLKITESSSQVSS
jgi:acyl-CoA synthetase (AMP-forming)/AMP-acid ligase II